MAVLGSPSLIALSVCVDAGKATLKEKDQSPELGSCVKVEVAVLSSPSLTVPAVSVDSQQH